MFDEASLSLHTCVYTYIYTRVQNVYTAMHVLFHTYVYMCVSLFVYPSIHLSSYLAIYLSTESTHPSIYLSIYLHVFIHFFVFHGKDKPASLRLRGTGGAGADANAAPCLDRDFSRSFMRARVQTPSKSEYMGIIWDPYSWATRLYVESFDHSSCEAGYV